MDIFQNIVIKKEIIETSRKQCPCTSAVFYSEGWIPRNGIVGRKCKCIFNFCRGCHMAF